MSEHDVSRRDFLKRGAALGGAVVWATPVIQIVGIRPALAQVASPACNVWYAVKIERSQANPIVPVCLAPDGNCLDVAEIESQLGIASGSIQEGCEHVEEAILAPESDPPGDWVVRLDEGCQFVEGSGRCTYTSGGSCVENVCTYDPATRTLTFHAGDQDISHIEFAFCCDD